MIRADAADGKVDAITPVVMEASAARRVWSLFKLRAVDALFVGQGAKALALATRDRVMAVDIFIVELLGFGLICIVSLQSSLNADGDV
jgi:hypothetical protein